MRRLFKFCAFVMVLAFAWALNVTPTMGEAPAVWPLSRAQFAITRKCSTGRRAHSINSRRRKTGSQADLYRR